MVKITKTATGYKFVGGGILNLEGYTIIDGENALGVYPVGSVYISVNNTSPAQLFGGTWEKIKDKFLLGTGESFNLGQIGGESSHVLSINEIPSHHHSIWSCNNWSGNVLGADHSDKVAGVGFVENRGNGEQYYEFRRGGQQIIENAGNGQAHNNMPPYLVVNIWKRI